MGRRGERYTTLGKKIARLARTQTEIAKVLGLTQQSVSGKLSGKIAVTQMDLERLSEKYKVPAIYFVTPLDVTPEMARAWEKILQGPQELLEALMIAATFTEPFVRQLLRVVRAMQKTASTYANRGYGDRESVADRRRVAEATKKYPS